MISPGSTTPAVSSSLSVESAASLGTTLSRVTFCSSNVSSESLQSVVESCSSLLTLATETLFLVGTGALGMLSVLQRGETSELIKYAALMTGGTMLLLLLTSGGGRERRTRRSTERLVVIVTGCDSGLGFNIAKLCLSLGFTVFAGCLNKDSEGSRLLQEQDGTTGRLFIEQLNITLEEHVLVANKSVKTFLEQNPDYELYALINNAGVMCFGEFEWQLNAHFEQQVDVNVIGTMRVTKSFLPMLRRYRARLINVTSHCALQALPGLSVYSATKAALHFWTDGLRMEMSNYGVPVVNFIPGSLVMQSNICANQMRYAAEMKSAFSAEQLEFYGSYFDEYNGYLKFISGAKPVQCLPKDHPVLKRFEDALLDESPSRIYKCEPWRYRLYHLLFRITPTVIRDWLVRRFVSMPLYRSPEKLKGNGIGDSL
ncbi:D-beta-hydroxybutyrate dehydrogenase, mitochondrial-like isoform X2 [Topomyia yanbarensis]|uniref:D-beta-hydroxybutyrate dehydrogenase, mitochondrial-like isoform X2 n=1 Tax=Topomyia yanbarensis TaxID=2498891 RepID=UPI00273C747D|nr:D-beta-hydroxybutyrate dehydrogenase, mitochondrial-like isoform X2 [Topomyia yanbarensis]XP_058840043.1 D-beta-hydroxybutyrate dehydrogenase, mitochondrial-like isoform X2 [Topomyia yanbarensis]